MTLGTLISFAVGLGLGVLIGYVVGSARVVRHMISELEALRDELDAPWSHRTHATAGLVVRDPEAVARIVVEDDVQ